MLMPRWKMIGATTIAAVAASVVAQSDNAPARVLERRADDILRAACAYIASADELSFHTEIRFDEVVLAGVKLEYTASMDVGLRRPNRVYAEYAGDDGAHRFWYDGKHVTLYNAQENVFSVAEAPLTVDATLDATMEQLGFTLPLGDLLFTDPYTTMMAGVDVASYVGLHHVEGVRCHHLLFLQDNLHWQIWIEDGSQLVPRKIVMTYVDSPEAPQYAAVFSDWDFAPRLPDRLFTAEPPDDAKPIPFQTVADAAFPAEQRDEK